MLASPDGPGSGFLTSLLKRDSPQDRTSDAGPRKSVVLDPSLTGHEDVSVSVSEAPKDVVDADHDALGDSDPDSSHIEGAPGTLDIAVVDFSQTDGLLSESTPAKAAEATSHPTENGAGGDGLANGIASHVDAVEATPAAAIAPLEAQTGVESNDNGETAISLAVVDPFFAIAVDVPVVELVQNGLDTATAEDNATPAQVDRAKNAAVAAVSHEAQTLPSQSTIVFTAANQTASDSVGTNENPRHNLLEMTFRDLLRNSKEAELQADSSHVDVDTPKDQEDSVQARESAFAARLREFQSEVDNSLVEGGPDGEPQSTVVSKVDKDLMDDLEASVLRSYPFATSTFASLEDFKNQCSNAAAYHGHKMASPDNIINFDVADPVVIQAIKNAHKRKNRQIVTYACSRHRAPPRGDSCPFAIEVAGPEDGETGKPLWTVTKLQLSHLNHTLHPELLGVQPQTPKSPVKVEKKSGVKAVAHSASRPGRPRNGGAGSPKKSPSKRSPKGKGSTAARSPRKPKAVVPRPEESGEDDAEHGSVSKDAEAEVESDWIDEESVPNGGEADEQGNESDDYVSNMMTTPNNGGGNKSKTASGSKVRVDVRPKSSTSRRVARSAGRGLRVAKVVVSPQKNSDGSTPRKVITQASLAEPSDTTASPRKLKRSAEVSGAESIEDAPNTKRLRSGAQISHPRPSSMKKVTIQTTPRRRGVPTRIVHEVEDSDEHDVNDEESSNVFQASNTSARNRPVGKAATTGKVTPTKLNTYSLRVEELEQFLVSMHEDTGHVAQSLVNAGLDKSSLLSMTGEEIKDVLQLLNCRAKEKGEAEIPLMWEAILPRRIAKAKLVETMLE